jgi:hypothetical protein
MVPYAIAGLRDGWHLGREQEGQPHPLVIAPAVANSWADGNFIDQCFDRGLLDMVDGISFHPYCNRIAVSRRRPETLVDVISRVKTELVSRGKPGFPIVLTEWGWSTHTYADGYGITEALQAKFAVRQLLMGYYTDIAINCIYSMSDARNEDMVSAIGDKHYGLFSTTGANFQKVLAAKPAVATVTTVMAALNGCHYVERIDMGDAGNLDSANDWCLVFWNSVTSSAKVVVWTIDTDIQKTSPDLKPLMGLSQSITVNFTDAPIVATVTGYAPPQ